jgi:inorganic pyrophosphatase
MSTNDPTTTYTVRKTGQPFTSGYRVYIEKENKLISAWHDIPLYHDESKGILNMVVEIPRWTNAKMEVRTNIMIV